MNIKYQIIKKTQGRNLHWKSATIYKRIYDTTKRQEVTTLLTFALRAMRNSQLTSYSLS